MAKGQTFQFHIQVEAGDLWRFSMYHANKGYLGIFNVLFTLASLYLLVTKWTSSTMAYRLLFLKAMKQAKNQRLKAPMDMTFTKEGFVVAQGEESMKVTWDQIGRAVGIPGEYILYMGRMRAYLLPDRVMGEEKAKFGEFLRETLPGERLKRV